MAEPFPVGTEERLFGGYAGRVLLLVASGGMVTLAGRLVLSPLVPRIIETLDVTPGQVGLALTLTSVLVAGCRYPGGRLADQLSHKTVLVGSLAASTVGFVVLSTAETFARLVVGMTAAGVGLGLYGPVAVAQLSDLYVRRRGQALGVHETFINLGGVLAGVLGVAALGFPSWRFAFLPVLALLVPVAVGLHAWVDDPYVVAAVDLDVRATGRRLLGTAGLPGALAAFATVAFAWQGVTGFLPAYLQVEKAFPPAVAANAFGGIFVVGIVANLVVGRLGDRVGRVTVGAAAAATSAVGLAVVVLADAMPVVLAGVGLLALGLTTFWPVMIAHVVGTFPDGSVAGDFGALSALFMGLGSLGPVYVGVVADLAGYAVAFAGIVGCLVVGTVVTVGLARRARAAGPAGRRHL